jgi:hypothetical protein
MMALDLTSLFTGAGGSILGFVAATVSREGRFNARVDQELGEMRRKVAKCEAERVEFAVVKAGMKMLLPEMRRELPDNPVLLAVATAFAELPAADDSMIELLAQIRSQRGENDEPIA